MMTLKRAVAAVTLSHVQLCCPDCTYKAPIVEMARHYQNTGHGKRN